MKKLLLLLLLSLTFIGSANANSIKGAFGYKLGEYVDSVENTYSANILYFFMEIQIGLKQFTPKNPLPFFNKYYIYSTPTSKLVFRIEGLKYTRGTEAEHNEYCKSIGTGDYITLKKMLEAKYADLKTKQDFYTYEQGTSKGVYWEVEKDKEMFIEGNKAIQLYCYKSTKSPPDYELTLTYIDKDLEKIAINEGQEIERKKILEESSDYDL